jgi:hypothetical protein
VPIYGDKCKCLHPDEFKKTEEKGAVGGRVAAFAKQKCRFAKSIEL